MFHRAGLVLSRCKVMKSLRCLHPSTVVRVVQAILLVAVVVTLALILVDRYQPNALHAPGTERTAPTDRGGSVKAFV